MGFISYEIEIIKTEKTNVSNGDRACSALEAYTTEHSLLVKNSFGNRYTPKKRYEDFCLLSKKLREDFWWIKKADLPELPSSSWLLYFPLRPIPIFEVFGSKKTSADPASQQGGSEDAEKDKGKSEGGGGNPEAKPEEWAWPFLSPAQRTAAFEQRREEDVRRFLQAVLGLACFSQSKRLREFLTDEQDDEDEDEGSGAGEGGGGGGGEIGAKAEWV